MVTPSTSRTCCAAVQGMRAFSELRELHNGRHSTVWSARVPEDSGAVVVIKGYSELRPKPRQLSNVTREILLLRHFAKARLGGVVPLLSSFEECESVYLIFKACMHGDLYQLMLRHKNHLSEEFVAAKVVVPLLSTLAHLHRLRIVHRDVKPENIFVSSEGEVLLGDFGLAAHLDLDRPSERVGTLDYMAPEVLAMPTSVKGSSASSRKSQKQYDEKVDVWAVGILAYEMLVGAPPFEVEDAKQTANLIMRAPVTEFPPGLSYSCREFILQALEKDPRVRPSAEELLQHPWIQQFLHGEMPAPPCPEPATKALKKLLRSTWTTTPLEALLDPVERMNVNPTLPVEASMGYQQSIDGPDSCSSCSMPFQVPLDPKLSHEEDNAQAIVKSTETIASVTPAVETFVPLMMPDLTGMRPLEEATEEEDQELEVGWQWREHEELGKDQSTEDGLPWMSSTRTLHMSTSTPMSQPMYLGATLEQSLGLSPRATGDPELQTLAGSCALPDHDTNMAGCVTRSFSSPGDELEETFSLSIQLHETTQSAALAVDNVYSGNPLCLCSTGQALTCQDEQKAVFARDPKSAMLLESLQACGPKQCLQEIQCQQRSLVPIALESLASLRTKPAVCSTLSAPSPLSHTDVQAWKQIGAVSTRLLASKSRFAV